MNEEQKEKFTPADTAEQSYEKAVKFYTNQPAWKEKIAASNERQNAAAKAREEHRLEVEAKAEAAEKARLAVQEISNEDSRYAALSEAEAEKLSQQVVDNVWISGETKDGPRTTAHQRQLHGVRVVENNKINWRATLKARRKYVAELN